MRPLLTAFIVCIAVCQAVGDDELSPRQAVLLGEVNHLWRSVGESVWPGWTADPLPIVFVGNELEFAIGFDGPLDGFEPSGSFGERSVQVRPRALDRASLAALDFQGVPCAIVGDPRATEYSPTVWVVKVLHELFHVLSMRRGSAEKVRSLAIGLPDEADWQLSFPFPYDDIDVMRLMHLQSYPIFLGITGEIAEARYNAGVGVEALEVMRTVLLERTGAEAAANYARFQEHDEGAGRYTEYRVAELASEDYEPTPEFAALEDFVPYARVWSEAYASSPFVIKHGGRAVRTRTLFYYTGMGKCLLLDRIGGDWKSRYFAPDVWLDDLIRDAVGAKTTLRPLEIGDAAPDFVLESVDGREVRLSELRGQVVLVDFWQWWCPPCIAAMPELSRLEDAHSELQVLGVSDRVDEAGQHRMAEVAEMVGTAYPMLLDPDAIVTRAYRVNSYPTLILVDRMGRVRWIHAGSVEGVMEDLDAAIQSALEN